MADNASPGLPSYPRRGLHGRLLDWMGPAIVDGELEAGKVIDLEMLARKSGVSRTVVRETLRVLEAKGMIGARTRIGTWVCPEADWNLLDPEVIGWRLRGKNYRQQLRELWELRRVAEPYAARLSAARANDHNRKELLDLCNEMETALDNRCFDDLMVADVEFHTVLLGAGGNKMLGQLHETVTVALHSHAENLMTTDRVHAEAIELHRRVAEAVAAGDPDEAELATRALIEQTAEDFDQVINRGRRPRRPR